MKRIGILTFHTSVNNGAVLQCYSLSKKIQQCFPNVIVEVVDYRMPKITKLYDTSLRRCFYGGTFLTKIKRLVNAILHYKKTAWERERLKVFQDVLCILPLSAEKIISDTPDALFDYLNAHYDIVVAGSDAIWNYVVRGFPNPYFLDASVHCKKLSYAASCYGMQYENIPEEQKKKIGEILSGYSFLGVRDKESEKFLDEVGCTLTPMHTCDPAVFVDVNDLPVDEAVLHQKLTERGFDIHRPAIAVMAHNEMCDMVRRFYGNQYQIVALYNYCENADVNLYDLTPYEWAYVFRYFKLTFTIFFHGTILSLRNGTPVICVSRDTDYAQTHMTKVEDLLYRVGLESCYFSTDYKNKNIDLIKAKADSLLGMDCRADINARMDKEAETSKPFFDAIKAIIEE